NHEAYRAYFEELFEQRRKEPQEDLLSVMLAGEASGGLSPEESMKNVILMFGAGHETTKTLISNMLLELARHPEETQKLRERPELIPSAVEEVLRYRAPAISISRKAMEDITVRGVTIPKGSM